jgi:hypothetical protein
LGERSKPNNPTSCIAKGMVIKWRFDNLKVFNCLLPWIQRRRVFSFASIIRYSQSNYYHKGGEFFFSSIIRYSQSNFYHYHSLPHHRYMNETLWTMNEVSSIHLHCSQSLLPSKEWHFMM